MKATVRNRFGAVLLLAPLAAAVIAARPAHAQQFQYVYPTPAPAVVAVEDNHYWRGHRQDNRAPRITDVTPDNGSRVWDRGRTHISARFHDWGSGIDYRNVTLRVDGRDVTYRARIEGNEVRYREDLAPGRHFAELVVRDRAGNATRETWSFDVVGRHWGERYGYYDGDRRY
ncbi:hypothetical protein [Ramlibacter albus]|uniref:Uncharacterized protein n=1 Tax=Ramlibacter albus TaxID=2079448 RepID=A0A923S5F5_9BURK|nr:hypothetical protein [Ramlibacter albus]MBC5768515.1 hypothetical protein [Ramlibacter albus]